MRDGYLIFKKYLTSNGKTNRLVEGDMLLSGLPESKKPVSRGFASVVWSVLSPRQSCSEGNCRHEVGTFV